MIIAWKSQLKVVASLRAASSQVRRCVTMTKNEGDRSDYPPFPNPNGFDAQDIEHNDMLKRYLEEGRVAELFQMWKEDHNKVYKDAVEEHKRLQSFEKTLKYVVEMNPKIGYSLGLNCFADQSREEMNLRRGYIPLRKARFPEKLPMIIARRHLRDLE